MIGSLNFGGSQSLVTSLQEHINVEEIQFDYIIDHESERQLEEKIISYGSQIFTLPKFKGYNLISYIRAWNLFFNNHKEYKIIHGHVRSTASIYLWIAKRHGLFTIAHSHSTNSGKGIQAILKNSIQYFIRFVADYFFSCSQLAGEWLFGKKIASSDRHKVLPNGINFNVFKYDSNVRERIKKELDIVDYYVIGHVGRFNIAKNHIFLIDLFFEFKKQNPQSKLFLVGGFDEVEYLKTVQKCQELNIANDVIFYGPSDEVHNVLNVFDCFVFPSLWEGLGIVAIEAQANGLNCLVSDNVPLDVKISNHIIYKSLNDSPNDWANCIQKFPQKRNECAYNRNFDIKYVANDLKNFYLEIGKNSI
jgi:glycosyltransferase involved in cell wall biosynthesis